jgi:hypothetical protein
MQPREAFTAYIVAPFSPSHPFLSQLGDLDTQWLTSLGTPAA